MKLFKRKKDDNQNENYAFETDMCVDSDDEFPPPPPPLSADKSLDHVSIVSSIKASNEDFVDHHGMEQSPFVHGSEEIENGVPTNPDSASRSGYSQVPITGQFRGIQKAQSFDEQEAGMDEIEVPSSSVVDRWNKWEEKYALRKKFKMFALIGFGVVAVILAVTLGSVYGTRARNSNKEQVPHENETGEGDLGGVDGDTNGGVEEGEETPPATGGAGSNYDDFTDLSEHLNNPAAKLLLSSNLLPASTRDDLEDEDSAAFKALAWIQSDINNDYNFGDATAMENEKTQLDMIQRFSVASLHHSLSENSKGLISGWMESSDVCVWEGITCGEQGSRRKLQDDISAFSITTIMLAEFEEKVEGTIPPEIAMLPDLTELLLYDNAFTGTIPDEIYSLTKLEILDLYNNELTGSISPTIQELTNLKQLYLGKNDFTGVMPTEIFGLNQLTALYLDDLNCDAQVFPDVSGLVNLAQLRLSRSQFGGVIPPEINDLVNLSELNIAGNGFEGEIPDISALVNLVQLDLSENWLTGVLPKLHNFASLRHLRLHGNMLSGTILNHYGTLESLVELRLGPNVYDNEGGLTGAIPDALASLLNLHTLDLRDNKLSGEIPDALGELLNLREFTIENNDDLTGGIPEAMCMNGSVEKLEADCHIRCPVQCCTDQCNRN
jgi:Leucine-rich repeat (LRR) protein